MVNGPVAVLHMTKEALVQFVADRGKLHNWRGQGRYLKAIGNCTGNVSDTREPRVGGGGCIEQPLMQL